MDDERAHLRSLIRDLAHALRLQARNFDSGDEPLCWCRFLDGTVNAQCEQQPQCVVAKLALQKAEEIAQ